MKTMIILAMHGVPPNDFPQHEVAEMGSLQNRIDHVVDPERTILERRHVELDAKMRDWPRTAQNDPFYVASHELATALSQAMGHEVIVGFNEFCAPSLDAALDQAVARAAERVIVITPMMTRGGEHSEVDIPVAVQHAQEQHSEVQFVYAWPFEVSEVAQFLAAQLSRFS